jgi:tRNA-dihydrouridine synthase B
VFKIGSWKFDNKTILAPMAGVTDRPFRLLCKSLGAGLVVSEMVSSDASLWKSRKSSLRRDHTGEGHPISVQIAGGDPESLALSAQTNVEHGAQIIDINMGCPAKKVCNKAAGSALLKDEALVEKIVSAVVKAVDVPVTLKIRTGWSNDHNNALTIAKIAEDNGIAALAIHGRNREQKYTGFAEYDSMAQVKQTINIPVFANGDITSAQKAKEVLDYTQADAVMIGRAAQGNPWIFREINHYLDTGTLLAPPSMAQRQQVMTDHLHALYDFYGEYAGIRIARKHVGWYLQDQLNGQALRREFCRLESVEAQESTLIQYFESNFENTV